MKQVLHIVSSPRRESSISKKLGSAVIEKIIAKYPDSILKKRDLTHPLFPHLEEKHISAFFTPAESRTTEQLETVALSDTVIAELKEADIIVIEAPLYNFSITSTLKSWLDHIARAGSTFRYTENGPEGLITNKKVYLAFSSGGIYSEGEKQAYDFVVPYLKKTLGFMGMTDISVVRAEGMSVPVIQETALQKGIESIVVE
ncbi:FMN-dependent NADH-azoreductase [Chryseobacterium lactis]|uniref:FMN dependent NADH:quinone oxidoreductase n=1 Tax=Chryseobacterium lactis TaxID=1241981 RepID=A0A3G6RSQ6_CHRLC|nr:NAD(P)H-dependent oxidoreductase [Chryseobacterium lactis]AZA84134.1 FMN-dependent NADH-azoreductase [Chryseobacterium lactis]AZB04520.1 FMN-dependent NADH-azoreductase [Chryseobacterium lactis]PNW12689.1 FMN-dependent NADH-azoreductase [Chryseobacterium lactis]